MWNVKQHAFFLMSGLTSLMKIVNIASTDHSYPKNEREMFFPHVYKTFV